MNERQLPYWGPLGQTIYELGVPFVSYGVPPAQCVGFLVMGPMGRHAANDEEKGE